MSWRNNFDDRQKAEIEFSKLYESKFNHGTDGHNAKLIIAKMALILDNIEPIAHELIDEVRSSKPSGERRTIELAMRLLKILGK